MQSNFPRYNHSTIELIESCCPNCHRRRRWRAHLFNLALWLTLCAGYVWLALNIFG